MQISPFQHTKGWKQKVHFFIVFGELYARPLSLSVSLLSNFNIFREMLDKVF